MSMAAETSRDRLREAIAALREYQFLAIQALEIAVLLDLLADIALEDVRAASENHPNRRSHRSMAIDDLESVVKERNNVRVGVGLDHIEQALHHLAGSR